LFFDVSEEVKFCDKVENKVDFFLKKS